MRRPYDLAMSAPARVNSASTRTAIPRLSSLTCIGDNAAFAGFCAAVGHQPTIVAAASGDKYTGGVAKDSRGA
jgi:hypothetical protein